MLFVPESCSMYLWLFFLQGGQKNLQTKADRGVEKLIRASLMSQFPNLNVIGEESEEHDPSADAKAGLDAEVLKMECPDKYKDINEEKVS